MRSRYAVVNTERSSLKTKGTTENSCKMTKLVSMDMLYFSANGDFSLDVNTGHTVVQTQCFACVDYASLSFIKTRKKLLLLLFLNIEPHCATLENNSIFQISQMLISLCL